MQVIQVISENKKTKGRFVTVMDGTKEIRRQVGYKAKIGCSEAIVMGPNGPETKHIVPTGGKNA